MLVLLGFMIYVCWFGVGWGLVCYSGKMTRPPDHWGPDGRWVRIAGWHTGGAESEPAGDPPKGGRGSGTDHDPGMTFADFQQEADDAHDEDHLKDGAGSHGDGGCGCGSDGLDDGSAAGRVAGKPAGNPEGVTGSGEVADGLRPVMNGANLRVSLKAGLHTSPRTLNPPWP